MGNVLFQAAHTISFALKHNQEFSLPNKTIDSFWHPLYLQHLVHSDYVQGREDLLINEQGMAYQEIEWKDEWKDKQVVLNGYWQTEKYFKDYRNEILYLFDFPYTKREGVVSLHIRRGDYVRLRAKHPEVTPEWYFEAMGMFPGKVFKIFSDDMPYAKEKFGHRGDCIFSINNNEVDDLVEMSGCESNICSPSTYAWWGMWLNRNKQKKVVFPSFWFEKGWDGMDTSDIVPDWCIKL
jgi:hypothetical protein